MDYDLEPTQSTADRPEALQNAHRFRMEYDPSESGRARQSQVDQAIVCSQCRSPLEYLQYVQFVLRVLIVCTSYILSRNQTPQNRPWVSCLVDQILHRFFPSNKQLLQLRLIPNHCRSFQI